MSENRGPQSGKMLAGAAIAFLVFGGAVGMTYSVGYVRFGKAGTGFQPTGDPPVTISDGSLHAKDANGWSDLLTTMKAPQLVALTPRSLPTGTIVANCAGMVDNQGHPLAAEFWATDQNTGEIPPTAITAGSTIIIQHDTADATTDDTVTIKALDAKGQLTITTAEGSFLAEDQVGNSNGSHNRRHSRPGNVSKIVVKDSNGTAYITWPASGKLSNQPHFSLGFCFQ